MAMTRKDFDAIALQLYLQLRNARAELRAAIKAGDDAQTDALESQMDGIKLAIRAAAAGLRATNPHFDTDRFVDACISGKGLSNMPTAV